MNIKDENEKLKAGFALIYLDEWLDGSIIAGCGKSAIAGYILNLPDRETMFDDQIKAALEGKALSPPEGEKT